jgi:hypothetical protein
MGMKVKSRNNFLKGLIIFLFAIICTNANISFAGEETNSLDRNLDPVVITGDVVGDFNSVSAADIVGFRFNNGWEQIPIQIDERKYVDFVTVYNDTNFPGVPELPLGNGTIAYADPCTYVGADEDPNYDSDDELVFMAKDAGEGALGCACFPAGVLSDPSIEVEVNNPINDSLAYIYLFKSDSNLTPDANQDYVTYDFNLLAGQYIPDYNLINGPNPEDSEANSIYYRTHFSDRWICDELNILDGNSTGVDILDRHKNMFGPGICGRTENTFSNGEGGGCPSHS